MGHRVPCLSDIGQIHVNFGKAGTMHDWMLNEAATEQVVKHTLELYIIHRFDYGTLIEETMGALHELVKMGKVRALGKGRSFSHCRCCRP